GRGVGGRPGGGGTGVRSSGSPCHAPWAASLSDPRCPCAPTKPRSAPSAGWTPWPTRPTTATSPGVAMPDPRPAAARRPRGWTALVTRLVTAAALAGGCSGIPVGPRPPDAAAAPPPGAGPCCGLLVRGPQPGWSPEDVVKNFLVASAIGANDFHVARQYLTGAASRAWQPGAAVTILTKEPRVSEPPGRLS